MAFEHPYLARAAASKLRELADAVSVGVAEVSKDVIEQLDAEWKGEFARAKAITGEVTVRLHGTDPLFLTTELWDAAEAEAKLLSDEIVGFTADTDVVRLGRIRAASDRLVDVLAAVPAPRLGRRSREAADAAQEFLRRTQELEQRAEESVEASVAALDASLEEQFLKGARQELSDLSDQVVALTARAAEVAENLRTTEVSTKTLGEAFNATVHRETERLSQLQSDWTSRFETAKSEMVDQWKDRFKELDGSVLERLAFFDGQRERTERILGVTAASETTGTFLDEAQQQKKEADRVRRFAMGFFVLALLLGALQVWGFADDVRGLSGAEIVAITTVRAAGSAIALSIGAWLARQVAHHRARERDARRMASELSAFRPFISELPAVEIEKQLIAAADRYFPGAKHDRPRSD